MRLARTLTASCTSIGTPLGRYTLVASERGLTAAWPGDPQPPELPEATSARTRTVLEAAREAFEAYFAGHCGALCALRVDASGTPFQTRVWRALREIPPGARVGYGEIARRIGRPGAARAVGAANHRNPIAIAIPCHRVVGSDGRLVGYAGGIERKRWLLEHEARATVGLLAQAASPKSLS